MTVSKKYNWNHLYIICFIFIIITGGCGDGGDDTENTAGVLSWDAPTTNADGTELTNLAGYKVYYGTSPGVYDTFIDVENTTSYTINDHPPATYYFVVTAYDKMDNESDYSNEVSKTIPK